MINQQLIDYIKQQKQQGVSDESIKTALRGNGGWSETDISEAFTKLLMPLNSISSVPIDQNYKPKGVRVISVLYFLGSILALGFGALAIFGASFFTQVLGTGFFGKFFAIGGIIFIALGILGIAVGIGLWRYKNWARLLAILLSVVGIIMTILSMLKGNISGNIFSLVISSIISGYLFFSPKVKTVFEPQKGVAILNKKLLWTSIVLLVLVVGLAIAFGSSTIPTVTPTLSPVVNTTENTPVSPTPTETTQVVPQTMSPKETYLKMRAEMDSVKTYADLEAITIKYGSKTQVEKINANRAQIDALPAAFKDQLATMAKNPASKDITTVQETISGNIATLNVSSTKPGFKGTVTMVLENNQWKLELESWKQQ